LIGRRLSSQTELHTLYCPVALCVHAIINFGMHVIFHFEMGHGLFNKGHDAIVDCINMVSSNLWPSARLTMKQFSQQNVIVIAWKLSSACFQVSLHPALVSNSCVL